MAKKPAVYTSAAKSRSVHVSAMTKAEYDAAMENRTRPLFDEGVGARKGPGPKAQS